MRTVLGRTAGRASLIVALATVVGSAAYPAVPAAARTVPSRSAEHIRTAPPFANRTVQIGTAVKYVRNPDGTITETR